MAQGRDGATTVTTTMIIAHMAGIQVFATGGIPWEMMVDSRATTGFPAARASLTSGAMSRYLFMFMMLTSKNI